MLYRYTATAAVQQCMYEYVDEYHQNREHSKEQHSKEQSPLHKAANQERADQTMYQKKYVRTCMLLPVCFPRAWSSWHLQVARLHLNVGPSIYYIMCLYFQSILPCERA